MELNLKLITTAIIGLLVASCASTIDKPHTGTSVLMKVKRVETPTRLVMGTRLKSYVVDLAYFIPNTRKCDKDAVDVVGTPCHQLNAVTENQEFWVDRVYDRFGVPMHLLWPKGSDRQERVVQPLNIELLVAGYPFAITDYQRLSSATTKLVALATDIGQNTLIHAELAKKMPEWQTKNLEDANALEKLNVK